MSELATAQQPADQAHPHTGIALLIYFVLGICFGITLTKSEVVSWFRIQEMFRFQSPRMYEIIASAVVVATASVALIKKLGLKALSGETITIQPKNLGHGVRYAVGGTIFGLGAHGGLSWPPLRAGRQWRHSNGRRHWRRASWNLAVWTPEVKTPALRIGCSRSA
jgi:hypothetical protein